jgi:hypothetical protein
VVVSTRPDRRACGEDDELLALVPLHAERHDVAGSDTLDGRRGELDVLGAVVDTAIATRKPDGDELFGDEGQLIGLLAAGAPGPDQSTS